MRDMNLRSNSTKYHNHSGGSRRRVRCKPLNNKTKGNVKMKRIYDYWIVNSKSQGYYLLKWCNGFWQQVSKNYIYLGNLKRFCPEANKPCHYSIEK